MRESTIPEMSNRFKRNTLLIPPNLQTGRGMFNFAESERFVSGHFGRMIRPAILLGSDSLKEKPNHTVRLVVIEAKPHKSKGRPGTGSTGQKHRSTIIAQQDTLRSVRSAALTLVFTVFSRLCLHTEMGCPRSL